MTSRGFNETDFEKVVDLFDRAVDLSVTIYKESGTKKLSDYKNYVNGIIGTDERVLGLKKEVTEFTNGFEFVPWPNSD